MTEVKDKYSKKELMPVRKVITTETNKHPENNADEVNRSAIDCNEMDNSENSATINYHQEANVIKSNYAYSGETKVENELDKYYSQVTEDFKRVADDNKETRITNNVETECIQNYAAVKDAEIRLEQKQTAIKVDNVKKVRISSLLYEDDFDQKLDSIKTSIASKERNKTTTEARLEQISTVLNINNATNKDTRNIRFNLANNGFQGGILGSYVSFKNDSHVGTLEEHDFVQEDNAMDLIKIPPYHKKDFDITAEQLDSAARDYYPRFPRMRNITINENKQFWIYTIVGFIIGIIIASLMILKITDVF